MKLMSHDILNSMSATKEFNSKKGQLSNDQLFKDLTLKSSVLKSSTQRVKQIQLYSS